MFCGRTLTNAPSGSSAGAAVMGHVASGMEGFQIGAVQIELCLLTQWATVHLTEVIHL